MKALATIGILLFLLAAGGFSVFSVLGQDGPACHDDEVQVTDSFGQHCEPKPRVVTFPAKECVKDFKPTDSTELRIPVASDGSLNTSMATLEGFDFKLVCGVVKK